MVYRGVEITPNTDFYAIDYELGSVGTTNYVELTKGLPADGVTLYRDDSPPSATEVGTMIVPEGLLSGESYSLMVDCGSADSAETAPQNGTEFDIPRGVNGTDSYDGTWLRQFRSVTSRAADSGTGTATVEFDYPAAVRSWEQVSFFRSEPAGSVTVDVQEYDGGSWSDVATDISPGGNIPADSGNRVRFVFNLDSSDGWADVSEVYQGHGV